MSSKHSLRCALAALCLVLCAGPVRAQAAADDSLRVHGSADSLASAPADSLVATASLAPRAPTLPPGEYDTRDFQRELPEGLDATLRRMPQLQLRVHGERGGPAYLSLSPIGESAPELLLDGVPQRHPADMDPAIYDLASGSLAGLRIDRTDFGALGSNELRLWRNDAVDGRTLTRTQFSSTRAETYHRSLALTTPRATHQLRLDFEEWKSELGVDYADLDTASPILNFGRAKQRRFHLELATQSEFGQAVLGFGRGRRRTPGSLLGSTRRRDATERWTGQVYAGLDAFAPDRLRRLRVYQSDVREVDESGGAQLARPQLDGQRLGLRAEQLHLGQGSDLSLVVERWSGRWLSSSDSSLARGRWIAQAGAAHEFALRGPWRLRAGLHGAWAEQLDDPDLGGSAVLGAGQAWRVEFGAQRALRIPSLFESDGRRSMDFADGERRDVVGADDLRIERQDRFYGSLERSATRWRAAAFVEHWMLSRGVGLTPVGQELHYVGDAQLDVTQLRGELELRGRLRRIDWSIGAAGHRVLGELESSRGRGSGWPTSAAQLRARAERSFFSPRNALIVEAFVKASGPRLDDRMAPLGGVLLPGQPLLSATLPAQQWTELRAALRLRDAELYLAWDNLLDVDYSESFGTVRRPRQLRWGLAWDFVN